MRSVEFSEGLQKIGSRAFAQSGIESVALPSSLRTIGGEAFFECKRLRSAQLNEGLEVLGAKEVIGSKTYRGRVFAESGLEDVVIPTTLKTIECGAF